MWADSMASKRLLRPPRHFASSTNALTDSPLMSSKRMSGYRSREMLQHALFFRGGYRGKFRLKMHLQAMVSTHFKLIASFRGDPGRSGVLGLLAGYGATCGQYGDKTHNLIHAPAVADVHHVGQQAGGGNGEPVVLHVQAVGGAIAAHVAQEGEHALADHGEHLGRGKVFEARPTQVVVGSPRGVFAFGEDALGQAAASCFLPGCARYPGGG